MQYRLIALLFPIIILSSCHKKPMHDDGFLPEDPNKASSELQNLRQLAQGEKKMLREDARGKLLCYIRRGMSKEHVEVWMGNAQDEYETEDSVSGEKHIIATYHCRLPELEGTKLEGRHLMTIMYEHTQDGLRVVKVEGPHFPD